MDDREVVGRQLGRSPRAFRCVVVRCPFGRPAVTEQEPYDQEGEPFPTTYYLTCPHLVAAVSRLEAAGGVEDWSERVVHDSELAAAWTRQPSSSGRSAAGSPPAAWEPTVARRSSSGSAAPATRGD